MKNGTVYVIAAAMIIALICVPALAAGDNGTVLPVEMGSEAGNAVVSDNANFEIIDGTTDPYVPGKPTRDSYIYTDEDLTARDGSQTISFKTNSDYPWWRIYVANNSNVAYNVTLVNSKDENQLKVSPIVVPAGKSVIIVNENPASGMRFLTVTAQDGSALSGVVTIRLASSADELET